MPYPTFVQGASVSAVSVNVTSASKQFTSKQTQGYSNVVFVNYYASTTITATSVTDTNGNVYSSQAWLVGANSTTQVLSFVATNIIGDTITPNTVTVHFSPDAQYYEITITEYSQSILDTSVALVGTGTAVSTGPLTTGGPNEILIAYFAAHGTLTPTGGFTTRVSDATWDSVACDLPEASQGTYSGTLTAGTTGTWVAVMVALMIPSVPPPFSKGEVILNGAQIGTPGSYLSNGNVIANVFDANEFTFWDGPDSSGDWAGLDAGIATQLTRVRISPRGGLEDRSYLGVIQASNSPTFAFGVTNLLWITSRPVTGLLLNEYPLAFPGNYYRYFRYFAWSAGSFGGIADLEFVSKYTAGMVAQAAPVTFAPFGGIYDIPTVVRLSCLTTDATIYYTLDGTTPTISSPQYTGPFVVSSTATVNAIAGSAGLSTSRVTSQTYSIGGHIISTNSWNDSNRGAKLWNVSPSIFQDPISNNWYMYGDNYDCYGVDAPPAASIGHNIYSSADLRNWKYEGIFDVPSPGAANGSNQIFDDRPFVLYNAKNNNYVAWVTAGYQAYVTVWTSPSPTGQWVELGTYSTLDGFLCQGDVSLFLDPADGVTAYLLRASFDVVNHIGITRLNSDYTNSDGVNKVYYVNDATCPFGQKSEAPRMFYRNGVYFWMTSGYSIWQPNTNLYVTSSNPLGPWSPSANPFQNVPITQTAQEAAVGITPSYTNAYDTQVSQIFNIPGRKGYVYLGDRFDLKAATSGGNGTSAVDSFQLWRLVWLPVSFPTNTTMSIKWDNAWTFDSAFPTVSGAPAAASGLNIVSGVATWINQEPKPYNLYIDRATDSGFTINVQSEVLTPVTTTFTPILTDNYYYYRIRTVNANGTSYSATVRSVEQVQNIASPLFTTNKSRITFNMFSKAGLPLATGNLIIGVRTNTVAEIAQNVRMILTTQIGMQVLERAFGSDWSFVDKPQPQAIAIINASILGAITRWEPRAVVSSVKYLGANAIGGEIDVNVVLDFILPSVRRQNTAAVLPAAQSSQVLDFNVDGSISVHTESIIQ